MWRAFGRVSGGCSAACETSSAWHCQSVVLAGRHETSAMIRYLPDTNVISETARLPSFQLYKLASPVP